MVGKRVDGDAHLVDIEFRGTSQRDEITCPATAVISLPSRDTGLAYLPTPPPELSRIAEKAVQRHGQLLAAATTWETRADG